VLCARGVTKRFAGLVAVDQVDLEVAAGERVGLIGPNGAGKTTFFNCLLGLLRPDAGVVELEGQDISGLSVHARSHLGIARTFQRIELFPDSTVREHLIIADRIRHSRGALWKAVLRSRSDQAEERARCDEVLELLGLRELADEPIERLSLGQGRLVEVGRALMTEPELLLLDEPSSGLDRTETRALAATLTEVQEEHGFAILLVEHDIELVSSFTTRSYLLDFGRVIASGPTAELMASDEMRAAYLGDLDPAASSGTTPDDLEVQA
jgi:branched-chain amino acid transport system ATP-binding protein